MQLEVQMYSNLRNCYICERCVNNEQYSNEKILLEKGFLKLTFGGRITEVNAQNFLNSPVNYITFNIVLNTCLVSLYRGLALN